MSISIKRWRGYEIDSYCLDHNKTSVRDKRLEQEVVSAERRFLGLVTVSNQASEQVEGEVNEAAVAGMFNLGNVLQLVGDGF